MVSLPMVGQTTPTVYHDKINDPYSGCSSHLWEAVVPEGSSVPRRQHGHGAGNQCHILLTWLDYWSFLPCTTTSGSMPLISRGVTTHWQMLYHI